MLPFSRPWLVSKGCDDQALTSLAKLRQLPTSDPRVMQEWWEIRAEVQFHKEFSAKGLPELQGNSAWETIRLGIASWSDCFKRGCWRRTHIGMGLMFFQQFVGISALVGDMRFEKVRENTKRALDLLFPNTVSVHGPRSEFAADNVRRSEHNLVSRRRYKSVVHGQTRKKAATSWR